MKNHPLLIPVRSRYRRLVKLVNADVPLVMLLNELESLKRGCDKVADKIKELIEAHREEPPK